MRRSKKMNNENNNNNDNNTNNNNNNNNKLFMNSANELCNFGFIAKSHDSTLDFLSQILTYSLRDQD